MPWAPHLPSPRAVMGSVVLQSCGHPATVGAATVSGLSPSLLGNGCRGAGAVPSS